MANGESDIDTGRRGLAPEGGARRTRLREFQAELMERMQAASTGLPHATRRLGLIAGGRRWLLNLQQAGEIVAAEAITEVPLTQDWYLGLVNIRGNLTGVVDLGRYLGLEAVTPDKQSRIIAFAPGLSFPCGLLASRVTGLRDVAEMTPQDRDPMLDPSWVARHYTDRLEQRWTEIDLLPLLQDPRFLQIGR
ncbi:twitching motility protein PilI [Noviherbaspirillum humi]|uniref:Twitching motility protein PilI n=1 Tax=Noviherbaspirillum humi TaxID=1688639 RepID=A0A239CTI1_9BURK|nr:chemotaxis protein CheW [Noviherbaspirillum humi]SNS23152.1 twitching motility protein PilI [Noviherbaspirillum humi]